MRTTKAKDSHIPIRIAKGDKELLQQAATIAGLSVSDFMRSHSLVAAKCQGNDQ
jgi:uncharacterized protein (DUF1778 family)